MNTIENTQAQPQFIAVSRLEKSPFNVRKTLTQAGTDEMKASLLAHGLMQNLVVHEIGECRFGVIAGARRLAALQALQADGKLPEDFAVPCQVVTGDHSRELSLAENTVRLAMHPADQFAAFAELVEQGMTAGQVAGRFGVDEALVVKRMKLARVAPALLEEYRSDRLTLECLMAFTITDDHKRQLKVFKALQDWQKDNPRHIRACLTEKMIDAGSKLARFVGLDAYAQAGGTSRGDFFGDEVYLEKPALLHKLADAKLAGMRKTLEAEGWGWVEINPERDWQAINRCDRLRPALIDAPAEMQAERERIKAELAGIERALEDTESDAPIEAQETAEGQLADIEEKLTAHVGFDAGQKKLAGCYVSIQQDGTPFIDKGLVKPEHKKQLAKLLKAEAGDGAPEQAKPKGGLSQALLRDLAAYRQQAAQAELAKHPAIAFDLLVFQVADSLLGTRTAHDGPDVHFRQQFPKPSVAAKAADPLATSGNQLPVAWLKAKTEAARFEAFRALTDAEKLDLLARCVALTLQPKLAPAEAGKATAYDAALALTGADVAAYWRPARETYLSRITREQLLAIARDTLGEAWAQSRFGEKKAALVDQLDRAFGDPEGQGRTPEQAGRLKRWLPAGMAFGLTAAKPARAKKARKAA